MQTGRQVQCRPAGRFNADWAGRSDADRQAGSMQTGCLDSVQAGWFAVDWLADRFNADWQAVLAIMPTTTA